MMKKILLIIPVIALSCNKKTVESQTSANSDSVLTMQVPQNNVVDSSKLTDTLKTSTSPQQGRMGMAREVEGNKIIRTADASQLPLTISEEFTEDNQEFIIKIKNFTQQNISGTIEPQDPKMNIRFNQIKLPNGSYDGPFGREMMYKSRENGEIWLIIGKSNMASGASKGSFSVNLK